jgi:FADH2 O2-dependent halogenase
LDDRLRHYSTRTLKELDATAQLVAALYASMTDFPLFTALSLLYFAAASFTETARRLGKAELAGETFLLGDHPEFGEQAQACFLAALRLRGQTSTTDAEKGQLVEQIYRTIAPADIAGLGRRRRRNWHPVNANDLFESSDKLRATRTEIEAMLKRCGF